MNSAQKVIKYVAIAFAILLSINIIVFGLNIAYIVLDSTNLIHNNSNNKISNVNFNEYSSYLDIDLKVSNLTIKRGDTFRYESNVNGLESVQDGNKLVIKDQDNNIFKRSNSYVTLYVPESLVFDKVVINMGVGTLNINDIDLFDATLNLGVGEANIESNLLGTSKIECGIGEVNLNLNLSEKDYTFKLDKGIGSIKLNGLSLSSNSNVGNGENIIDIDGGIGSISIKTR